MESFNNVYDNLSVAYAHLESIMGSLYEELRKDPSNQKNSDLLQGLGEVATKILSSQKDFVEGYGEKDIKDVLMANIDSKETVLKSALGKDLDCAR